MRAAGGDLWPVEATKCSFIIIHSMVSACLLTGQFGYKIGSRRSSNMCALYKHIVKVVIYSYDFLLPAYFGKFCSVSASIAGSLLLFMIWSTI
jgi:hypothetical protein